MTWKNLSIRAAAAVWLAGVSPCPGQTPPNYDFHWVTVGAVNNPAYGGPDPYGFATGRGSVGYSYRISQDEVSTGQWLGFVNTFSTQSDDLRFFAMPTHWGAVQDTSYHGPGIRWRLRDAPDAAMRPVFGISWRIAAMYCNWLVNNRSSDLSAIANGAYDASTFTDNPDWTVNDQEHHNPGAAFWIPTWDEWLKSAHFDPNRYGPDQPGWWQYSHTSDTAPIQGLPGQGQTSVGLRLPNFGELDIPLGAYPSTLSPWGLLDVTGGAAEWTEELYMSSVRVLDGTGAGGHFPEIDLVYAFDSAPPSLRGFNGLRIASAVPSGSAGGCVMVFLVALTIRRRQ